MMFIRLRKGYTIETGKRLVIGQVTRRKRKEAEHMIKENIAEEYRGPFPPKKIKTDFFKPK